MNPELPKKPDSEDKNITEDGSFEDGLRDQIQKLDITRASQNELSFEQTSKIISDPEIPTYQKLPLLNDFILLNKANRSDLKKFCENLNIAFELAATNSSTWNLALMISNEVKKQLSNIAETKLEYLKLLSIQLSKELRLLRTDLEPANTNQLAKEICKEAINTFMELESSTKNLTHENNIICEFALEIFKALQIRRIKEPVATRTIYKKVLERGNCFFSKATMDLKTKKNSDKIINPLLNCTIIRVLACYQSLESKSAVNLSVTLSNALTLINKAKDLLRQVGLKDLIKIDSGDKSSNSTITKGALKKIVHENLVQLYLEECILCLKLGDYSEGKNALFNAAELQQYFGNLERFQYHYLSINLLKELAKVSNTEALEVVDQLIVFCDLNGGFSYSATFEAMLKKYFILRDGKSISENRTADDYLLRIIEYTKDKNIFALYNNTSIILKLFIIGLNKINERAAILKFNSNEYHTLCYIDNQIDLLLEHPDNSYLDRNFERAVVTLAHVKYLLKTSEGEISDTKNEKINKLLLTSYKLLCKDLELSPNISSDLLLSKLIELACYMTLTDNMESEILFKVIDKAYQCNKLVTEPDQIGREVLVNYFHAVGRAQNEEYEFALNLIEDSLKKLQAEDSEFTKFHKINFLELKMQIFEKTFRSLEIDEIRSEIESLRSEDLDI